MPSSTFPTGWLTRMAYAKCTPRGLWRSVKPDCSAVSQWTNAFRVATLYDGLEGDFYRVNFKQLCGRGYSRRKKPTEGMKTDKVMMTYNLEIWLIARSSARQPFCESFARSTAHDLETPLVESGQREAHRAVQQQSGTSTVYCLAALWH